MMPHAFHTAQVDTFIRLDQNLKVINCSTQKQLVSKFLPYFNLNLFVDKYINLIDVHLDLILVSKPAPHFEGTAVVNGEFTQLSLSDYAGKYVVFFFYPLDL